MSQSQPPFGAAKAQTQPQAYGQPQTPHRTPSQPRVATPPPATASQRPPPPRKTKPEHKLQVEFDGPTWAQVEELAAKTGTTRAGLVRRAVRILARVVKRHDEGYEIAFLKKGENPVLLELF